MKKKKHYDPVDRIHANMCNVHVSDFVERMESLDEDQRNEIISRLLSEHDSVIKSGIKMFKDI